MCRYYLDLLYVEPVDTKRPVVKQAQAAEELLKEAEEQAGIDEVRDVQLEHTCLQADPLQLQRLM